MNIVKTRSTASDGSLDVAEATDLQVGESLIQIVGSVSEEG